MATLSKMGAGAFAVALAALVTGPALAASADDASRSDQTTRHDFSTLSRAGSLAFDDAALARLAIFDGHPSKAATLIANAETEFNRADIDQTAFIKAEDALNPPSSMRSSSASGQAGQPTVWLPVAEGFVLSETLVPPAGTDQTLDKANASLRANQRRQAIETLKVAHVSAIDTVALAPLDETRADLHRASQLVAAGDYYGAGQALRALEQRVRYDSVSVPGKSAT